MVKDKKVDAVKKSTRVRREYCYVWRKSYHMNCNCLADEDEIEEMSKHDNINKIFIRVKFLTVNFLVRGYPISWAKYIPTIKRKRGRPKKNVRYLYKNDRNNNQLEIIMFVIMCKIYRI